MSYGVMRVMKFNNNNLGGIGEHVDRCSGGQCVSPPNADPERINNNLHWDKNGKSYSQKEWAKFTDKNGMKKRVNDHIKEKYKKERAVRKDAVRCVEYIFSSDNEKMNNLFREGRAEEWIKANREFLADIYGEENILSMHLHMDEKTPHLEVLVVPITEDGGLSFKSFVDGKKDLVKQQDLYAEKMQKFGLKRGEKGSAKKHVHQKEVTKNTYNNEYNRS